MTLYYGFLTFFIVTICVCLAALFVTLYRDAKLQQRHLIYVLFSCLIVDLGFVAEIMAKSNVGVVVAAKGTQIFGTVLLFVSLTSFVSYVCRVHVPVWFTLTLYVIDIIIVIAYQLDTRLNWFFEAAYPVVVAGIPCVRLSAGFLCILYIFVAVVTPYIGCLIIVLYSLVNDRNIARRKEYLQLILVMAIIGIVPIITYKSNVLGPYDLMVPVVTYFFSLMGILAWKDQGVDVVAEAALFTIDHIEIGVISVNKYNEILYYNAKMAEIVPDIEKYLGSNIDRLNVEELSGLKPGETGEIDIEGHRYHVKLATDYDETFLPKGYTITFTDMTDMLEMVERIQDAQRKADEANQTKSQFLANISHEIRTPMNAIMGLSDLIIEESRGRKVYDMAVTIKKASQSMLSLVNNILDFSKIEAGKAELVIDDYELYSEMDDICQLLKIVAAQHGLQVKFDIDKSLPCKLKGDSQKIRQVIINIMNNGIKFTKEGHVRLSVSGTQNGNNLSLVLIISDTGIGIKPENLSKIFGEFEQVDKIKNKSIEGSGLGLAISRSFIEMMGGVIEVDSVYGEGTTFTIRINQEIVDSKPIELAMTDVVEEVEEAKLFKVADNTNLLIVDDNKVNLMVAKSVVEAYGFVIDQAASGKEALELISHKEYDIILMDHMMPEMDGIETTAHIREMYQGKERAPLVVALTANAVQGVREMFLSHGFDEFITKPIEKAAMYKLLLKLVPEDKRTFVDEEFKDAEYTEDELAELWMDGVDVRRAVEGRGAGVEGYLELLHLYLLEGKQKLIDMRNYLEDGDIRNYEIIVHGIKSTSANIGADLLSEMAKEHEFKAKAEDMQYCRDHLDELCDKYNKILVEVERVCEKQDAKKAETAETKLPGLTLASLRQAVYDIISLSEAFKTKEAAEMVDKLLKYELDPYAEAMLSDIKTKYKMYDDDGAEELLHNLRTELGNRG